MPRNWKAEGRCTLQILITTRDDLKELAESRNPPRSMSEELRKMVERVHRRLLKRRSGPQSAPPRDDRPPADPSRSPDLSPN